MKIIEIRNHERVQIRRCSAVHNALLGRRMKVTGLIVIGQNRMISRYIWLPGDSVDSGYLWSKREATAYYQRHGKWPEFDGKEANFDLFDVED